MRLLKGAFSGTRIRLASRARRGNVSTFVCSTKHIRMQETSAHFYRSPVFQCAHRSILQSSYLFNSTIIYSNTQMNLLSNFSPIERPGNSGGTGSAGLSAFPVAAKLCISLLWYLTHLHGKHAIDDRNTCGTQRSQSVGGHEEGSSKEGGDARGRKGRYVEEHLPRVSADSCI